MKTPTRWNGADYPSFREAWRAAGFSMKLDRQRKQTRKTMKKIGAASYKGERFERIEAS